MPVSAASEDPAPSVEAAGVDRDSVTSSGTWRTVAACAVAVVVLAGFFLLTRPGNVTEAEDAWRYSVGVRDGGELDLGAGAHPYTPMVMRPVFLALRGLGFGIEATTVMSTISAVGMALAVVLLVILLWKGIGLQRGVALCAATGLALSYVFWRYSAEQEIYGLAIATAMVAAAYVYMGRVRPWWLVITILLTIVATVTHLLNLSLLVGLVPLVVWHRAPTSKRRTWAAIALVATVLGGMLVWAARPLVAPNAGRETYDPPIAAAVVHDDSVRAVAMAVGFSPRNVPEGAVGLTQAVVSANFALGFGPVLDFMDGAFPGRDFSEERYLGERIPRWQSWLALATLVTFLGLSVTLVVAGRRGFLGRLRHPLALPFAGWFLVYLGMMILSEPANPELWTAGLPPLWALLACLFIAPVWERSRLRWLPIALVAVLGVHNLIGGILPVASADTDLWRARNAWLLERLGPEDIVVLGDDKVQSGYLRYLSPARVMWFDNVTPEEFDEQLAAIGARRGHVYAYKGFIDPRHEKSMTDGQYDRLRTVSDRLRGDFVKIHDDEWGGVFEYCPVGRCGP